MLERADRCQLCGTAGWEWEEDPGAYTPVFHTCPGCRLKDVLNDDPNTPKGKGTTIRLVPQRVAERLTREALKRGVPKRKRRGGR